MPCEMLRQCECERRRIGLAACMNAPVVNDDATAPTPPTVLELRTMLAAQGGELRRLCNTSGRDYRELGLGAQLESMTPEAVFALLASRGNLVKRPFAIGAGVNLVGFDEAAWSAAMGGK